jgi:hypothetical protein
MTVMSERGPPRPSAGLILNRRARWMTGPGGRRAAQRSGSRVMGHSFRRSLRSKIQSTIIVVVIVQRMYDGYSPTLIPEGTPSIIAALFTRILPNLPINKMPSFQYGGGILTTRSLEHNDERNRPVSKPVVVTGGSGKLGKCELGF